MIITCTLQGTPCNTGFPRSFYGGKICSVVACEAEFTVEELVTAAAFGAAATATALTTYAYAPVVGLTPSCPPRLVHPRARHQTQTAFRLGQLLALSMYWV